MKQSVAIMDFGTSKITVLIGSRGINNSICIDGIGVSEYFGFSGGEWHTNAGLSASVERAISAAESYARTKITRLYVGVPGDFLLCRVNEEAISLGRKRRIQERDVEALHKHANVFGDDENYKVINIQPIYYKLDDERKLILPVGMASTRLAGSISFMLADIKNFIEPVEAALEDTNVTDVDFVASPLAEMLFLFDDFRRDRGVMFADAGAFGTTFVIGRGDGICRQYFFPWGGDRITLALSENLDISMREADKLKRQVSLTVEPNYIPPDDEQGFMQTEYTVDCDYDKHVYSVKEVNEIVKTEILKFARYVEKTLKVCDYALPETSVLAVTGGGLSIRGATDYLGKCLNREVELVRPSLPLFDKPYLSSSLAVMDMVLSGESAYNGPAGKFRRLFAKR